MSKHFLPKEDTLVRKALQGYAAVNPTLSVLLNEKVVYNNQFDGSKVSLISGGGSGHEPGWPGLVGGGMLAACAQGEVFALPNFKNVQAAEKATHSDKGVILIITNYTGDNLYFGMAQQELIARYGESKVKLLRVTDDVSLNRSSNGLVGRRTLAGIAVIIKLMGALAEENAVSLDQLYRLGEIFNANTVSINAGLDHVHIPGHPADSDYGKLQPNEIEIGLGIHNEPGFLKLDTIPSNEQLVAQLLQFLLLKEDPERSYLDWTKGDEFVLLFNNLGGLPIIEERALVFETINQLGGYGIVPVRVIVGAFVTSLNAPTFTITLFNVSGAAAAAAPIFRAARNADGPGINADGASSILALFDAPTTASNWPAHGTATNYHERIVTNFSNYADLEPDSQADIAVDPAFLRHILTTAAANLIKFEPQLTDWDTKMGDGDCGKMLELGATAVLKAVDEGVADAGSVMQVLNCILAILANEMGGTLGAILYIFAKALINSLTKNLQPNSATADVFAVSLVDALEVLKDFTKARQGHRTVMDVLIPFVADFAQHTDLQRAVAVAASAAEGTRKLVPKLGRASYVGGLEGRKDFPPDPGAYGVYQILVAFAPPA